MRAARRAVLLLVVALVAGGCSPGKDSRPTLEGRVHRATDSSIAAPGAADPTTTTVASGAPPSGGTAPGAGASDGSAAGAGGAPADPASAAAATGRLDAFLDALSAQDYQGAAEGSAGAVRFFAFVRSVLKANADAHGTQSTYGYTERQFTPGGKSGDKVAFTGRAVLTGSSRLTSGGTIRTSETLTEPVVALDNGGRVVDLRVQGLPLELSPGGSTQTLGSGVQVRLVGALSQADRTEVVVQFLGSGDFGVSVQGPTLVYSDGDVAPIARALIGSYLYLAHPRRSGPLRWHARINIDDGPATEVTLGF